MTTPQQEAASRAFEEWARNNGVCLCNDSGDNSSVRYCRWTQQAYLAWQARGEHDVEVMKQRDELLAQALEVLDMTRFYLRSGTDDMKHLNDARDAITAHLSEKE